MTGSAQLRLYVDARRKGASHDAARDAARDGCGLTGEEARLTGIAWDRGELEDVGPPFVLKPPFARPHVHVREDEPSAAGEETMFQDDQKPDEPSSDAAPEKHANVSQSAEQLRVFISRIENVQGEIDELNADKAEIFKEAKNFGLDTAVMKVVLKRRKAGQDATAEMDVLVRTYEDAMHTQIELPLTRH